MQSPYTESDHLLTISALKAEFERIGLRPGQTILMHSAMSAFKGYIVGGPVAVIDALLQVLTPEGTLVMPTFTSDNSDPAMWKHPPVPEAWWETIRAEWPPFRPEITPTRQMGVIVECFRKYPGVLRSSHPACSFAAWGKNAAYVTADQPLNNYFGDNSPLDRVYALDGYVLLLGIGHGNNTSMHRAEYRAQWPGKAPEMNSSAILRDGKRVRVTYSDDSVSDDDFPEIGAAYETETGAVTIDQIADAPVRFMRQRPLIDYAAQWMTAHRPGSLVEAAP
jgi:aminoglycoside 3-N-acetyltransferase